MTSTLIRLTIVFSKTCSWGSSNSSQTASRNPLHFLVRCSTASNRASGTTTSPSSSPNLARFRTQNHALLTYHSRNTSLMPLDPLTNLSTFTTPAKNHQDPSTREQPFKFRVLSQESRGSLFLNRTKVSEAEPSIVKITLVLIPSRVGWPCHLTYGLVLRNMKKCRMKQS